MALGRPGGRAHRPGQHPCPADRPGRRYRRGPVVAAPARPGPARRPDRHRRRRPGHDHHRRSPAGGQPGRRQDPLAPHCRRLACPHRGRPAGDLQHQRPPDRLRRPDRPAALDQRGAARAADHPGGRQPRPGHKQRTRSRHHYRPDRRPARHRPHRLAVRHWGAADRAIRGSGRPDRGRLRVQPAALPARPADRAAALAGGHVRNGGHHPAGHRHGCSRRRGPAAEHQAGGPERGGRPGALAGHPRRIACRPATGPPSRPARRAANRPEPPGVSGPAARLPADQRPVRLASRHADLRGGIAGPGSGPRAGAAGRPGVHLRGGRLSQDQNMCRK